MELFGLRGANVNVVNVLLDSPWISEVSGPVGFPCFFKLEHELLHHRKIVIFTEAEVFHALFHTKKLLMYPHVPYHSRPGRRIGGLLRLSVLSAL